MTFATWLRLSIVFYVVIPLTVFGIAGGVGSCARAVSAYPDHYEEVSPSLDPSFSLSYPAGVCECWFDYDTEGLDCDCDPTLVEEALPSGECEPKHGDFYEPLCGVTL